MSKLIRTTDAATGRALPPLRINESLAVGDSFRLIGRTIVFKAVRVTAGPIPCVTGVSDSGFKTTARIVDTCQPHSKE